LLNDLVIKSPPVRRKVKRSALALRFTSRLSQGLGGQASQRLGLNRSTLRYKIRELGLSTTPADSR
jgi:hypothetical protein